MREIKEKVYYTSETSQIKEEKLLRKLSKQEQTRENLLIKIDKMKAKGNLSKRGVNALIRVTSKKMSYDQKIAKTNKELKLLADGNLEKHGFFKSLSIAFSEIEYKKQVKIWGIIFIAPWLIGMILFFIPSVLTTIGWSFSKITLTTGGIKREFVGFANFTELFGNYVIDNNRIFSAELLLFVQNLIIDLPIIIIFSIIISVLLNKEFKGHVIIKSIFFIPVIYNMALITSTLTGGFGQHVDDSLGGNIGFLDQTIDFFLQIGIGESLVTLVVSAVDRIFTIVNLSGIQILIFIAAIQAIPRHLYEAAEVEGATKYESFWKITVPMITPMIITAAIYTVIDSFGRAPIFRFLTYAVSDNNHGLAAAISVSYFLINVLIIGFIYLLFKGRVFYHDEK